LVELGSVATKCTVPTLSFYGFFTRLDKINDRVRETTLIHMYSTSVPAPSSDHEQEHEHERMPEGANLEMAKRSARTRNKLFTLLGTILLPWRKVNPTNLRGRSPGLSIMRQTTI
jgi:hypothetical protein